MTPQAFEDAIEAAAMRGATKALAAVGLDDAYAKRDIAQLRDLAGAYRIVRNGALKQLGVMIMLFFIGAVSVAIGAKLNLIKLP